MKKTLRIQIDKDVTPARQLKSLYYTYLISTTFILVLPWYIFIIFLFSSTGILVFSVILLAILILILAPIAYWIRKYYDSMLYKFTESEITWRRGVWFKNTGIVPYNRITNVDIVQGPISRRFGIASLKIQTAGYSGKPMAEIRVDGIREYEELREMIIEYVKGKKPAAVETYEEENINLKILKELTKIRELLEESSRK